MGGSTCARNSRTSGEYSGSAEAWSAGHARRSDRDRADSEVRVLMHASGVRVGAEAGAASNGLRRDADRRAAPGDGRVRPQPQNPLDLPVPLRARLRLRGSARLPREATAERSRPLLSLQGGRMSSPTEITAQQLARLIGLPDAPIILDVRSDDAFARDARLIPTALRRDGGAAESWAPAFSGRRVVVSCQHGA